MTSYGILNFAGIILIAFGLVAGAALLLRAIASTSEEASWGVSTLWGIFIICTAGGLILIILLMSFKIR